MLIQSWTSRKDFHFFFYDLTSEPPLELKPILTSDESKHLASIKSAERARSFLSSRARLRQLFSQFSNCNHAELKFSQNAQGKIFLIHPTLDISFSVSHSHERLLILICTTGASVGVDLENKKTDADLDLIARGFFTDDEKTQLTSLSDTEKRSRILEIWCLKEARFKMQGNSLAQALNERHEIHHLDADYVYALCYRDFLPSAEPTPSPL